MLQKDSVSAQKRQEMLELILANIGRITRIIDDLRVFSRQERLDSDKFELIPAIEETLKLLRYQNEGNHVEMLLQHDNRRYMIEGSKSQFQQLMINLLLNATQSIETAGGSVRVELKQAELPTPTAMIKIIDNGCGIAEEQLDQIFDPFFTTKRDWHGTGLGLAVSHRIVQLLKGTISVTSKVGQGTTFTIALPLLATGNSDN
jgi:signal transduction histidine kinase